MCTRLTIEHDIYWHSPVPNETWASLFYDLFKIRNLWKNEIAAKNDSIRSLTATAVGERFKINVYARFRPLEVATGNYDPQ
jgi:hypothetical protein